MIDIKTINELGQIIRGVTYKPSDASTKFIEGYVSVLRAGNIKNGRIAFGDFVYVKPERVKDVQRIQKGDVVIAASTGSKKVIGKAAQIKENWDGSFGGFCIAFRPDTNLIDPKYFGYFFQSKFYRKMISHMSSGANINNLKKDHFDRLKIPLPTLEEQKQIVRILDQADSLRQKRQKAISLLDDYLKAVFLEMFGDKLSSNEQESSELRKYVRVVGGYAFKSLDFKKTGVPVIKIGTVNKGYFDLKSCSYMPEDIVDNQRIKKYLIFPGDLLMSLTGTVGKKDYGNICFADDSHVEYLLNQRVAKIDYHKEIFTPEFLFYYFKLPEIKRQLTSVSRGVRQANISNEDILKLRIVVPSIDLQKRFSLICSNKKYITKKMFIQSQELNTQFQALMQQFFSA